MAIEHPDFGQLRIGNIALQQRYETCEGTCCDCQQLQTLTFILDHACTHDIYHRWPGAYQPCIFDEGQ